MTQPQAPSLLGPGDGDPVEVINPGGTAPVLLVCEHAACRLPAGLGDMGLTPEAARSHAAWDIGARDLALALSQRLDAALVAARFSRLVFDCNRPEGAADAMPDRVERFDIPGNRGLDPARRAARARAISAPFHRAVAAALDARPGAALVTLHSFSPTWHGTPRDTRLGLLHDADPRLALAMAATPGLSLSVEINRPYGPADGVTHSLIRHALPRGALNVMVEVRSDLLADPDAVTAVADDLIAGLEHGLSACRGEARP